LSSITLSLDGAIAATHATIRKKAAAFERVLDAARQYISLGYCVNFLMTLNRLNLDEMDAAVKLASELGAKRITFASIIPNAENTSIALTESEKIVLYERVKELQLNASIQVSYTSNLHTVGGINICQQ
jgi:MoaA/NifB/PqqE/SkfB family radical SAM enzyme